MEAPVTVMAVVFWLLAGLALFLYGIEMMSRALRKAAGPAIRKAFDFVTRTRFHALLAGTIVTGLIQSSSASTVMVVGFINAGLLKFSQSIGIILGANIGATITPQITAFNLDDFALPLLGMGFLLTFFVRKRVARQSGFAIMGFGMLFFGLLLMKFAVTEYLDDIQSWLTLFTEKEFLGQLTAFLLAAAATAIIQSSAATIAMLQVIAVGAEPVGLELFLPLIAGAQVGTCITAMLASMQASLSARRAAVAHLVFNMIGTLVTLCLYKLYLRVVPLTSSEIARQIANCHLLTRLVNVMLFVPFVSVFSRFISRLLPGEDRLSAAPAHLDFREVRNPEKALASATREILRMYNTCLEMLQDSVRAFIEHDSSACELVMKREALVDDLYHTTGEYLLMVSRGEVTPELATRPALWMHLMSDVERIGDHAENIVELCGVRSADPVRFSRQETGEMEETLGLILQMGAEVNEAMQDQDEGHMLPILQLKEQVNYAVDQILDRHAERLEEGVTTPTAGILFVEAIMNLRRVANHLRNIAASVTSKAPEHTAQIRKLKEELP
ncbi:Na/Pi cotransporter family protein [Verrucomicrobiota bacterium]